MSEYKPLCAGFARWPLLLLALAMLLSGCKSPTDYRDEADKVAHEIISDAQMQALGHAEDFFLERPSDILRRRLMTEQNLRYTGKESLGVDQLETDEHWPDPNYVMPTTDSERIVEVPKAEPLRISLVEALQISARNSFSYQSRKEQIFKTALALDLERNNFRGIFNEQVENLISLNKTGGNSVVGMENSSTSSVSKNLKNGTELSGQFAVDLANLLTQGGRFSRGLKADATITIPLLRGSGEHIAAESLVQAERDMLYEIYNFERFKRTFAVNIASEYYNVLKRLDQIDNAEANYRGLVMSVRRARRRADAGELTEIEVDQAVQQQLGARERWISAMQSYESGIDDFKILLGLPADANIELHRSELKQIVDASDNITKANDDSGNIDEESVPADAPINLPPPSKENIGPYEISYGKAIDLAIKNRLDLRAVQGNVYDNQRNVIVKADRLRGELTLLGTASAGGNRSVGSAGSDDANIEFNRGFYSSLLTLDLPIERTAERNSYRNSLIDLEASIREFNTLEDDIKLNIRNKLRNLLNTRESIQIQAKAVVLAEKRVDSTNLFMQAGRAQIRDMLEAQDDLLSAQNSLTSAIISYRVAELELQRDMGLLQVNSKGLFDEFDPEALNEQGQ